MRQWLVLLILAAGCASSAGGPRLEVELDELYEPGQGYREVGQHLFHVYVTNHSSEAITINTIHLDLAGTSDYEIESPTLTVSTPVAPDQTQDFEIVASIFLSQRRSNLTNYPVDSLQVIIGGTGPAGNFVDSGTHSIIRRRLPG